MSTTYSFHLSKQGGGNGISTVANTYDKTVGDTTTYGNYSKNKGDTVTDGGYIFLYGCPNTTLTSLISSGAKIINIYATSKFKRYSSSYASYSRCGIRCTHDLTLATSYTDDYDCGDGYIYYINSTSTITAYTYTFSNAVAYFNAHPSSFSTVGLYVIINYAYLYDFALTVVIADTYTATFKNYDGTVLQTSSVNEGDTPVYSGATPTKPSTAQYTYTFSGWDTTPSAITGDTTYTAQFTANLRYYPITVNATGCTVSPSSASVGYGSTQTFTITPDSGYELSSVSWNGVVQTVTGNTFTTPAITADSTLTVVCEQTSVTVTITDFHFEYADEKVTQLEANQNYIASATVIVT